jgi:hypothetical protein
MGVCKYFHCVNMCVNIFVKKKLFFFTLHYAFECTLYVRSQTRTCVRTHLRLFEHKTPFHKHIPARMRSTVLCTFERIHGLVFKLTCVCLSAGLHFTHMFLHVCD